MFTDALEAVVLTTLLGTTSALNIFGNASAISASIRSPLSYTRSAERILRIENDLVPKDVGTWMYPVSGLRPSVALKMTSPEKEC